MIIPNFVHSPEPERNSDKRSTIVPSPAPIARKSQTFWNWAPPITLLIASLTVCALVSLRPRDPERLVAIFPPWWSVGQSLTAASLVASVSGLGAFSFIVAVRGTQADLASRLRAAGALLVVDGTRFKFCGTRSEGIER